MDNQSLEDRIAKLEAEGAIRQLAIGYAHAVDSRDLDSLVALFSEDAVMPGGTGRAAVRARYGAALLSCYRSVHSVTNHLIELVDDNHARGRVYTRAEEERKDSWCVRAMAYFDEYRRHGGKWYFFTRETHYWYLTDFDRRPHAPGFMHPLDSRGRTADLPHLFPTWERFWTEAGGDRVAKLTNEP